MSDDDPFLGGQMHKARQFSEHTMEVIDEEVHNILQAAADSAFQLLKKHSAELESVTRGLMEKEELDRHEIEELIGISVHKAKTTDFLAPANILAPDTPPTTSGNAEISK
jgi:cell division protease FtsH